MSVRLLADPERVRHEYEQRLGGSRRKGNRPTEQLDRLIAGVRRGISR